MDLLTGSECLSYAQLLKPYAQNNWDITLLRDLSLPKDFLDPNDVGWVSKQVKGTEFAIREHIGEQICLVCKAFGIPLKKWQTSLFQANKVVPSVDLLQLPELQEFHQLNFDFSQRIVKTAQLSQGSFFWYLLPDHQKETILNYLQNCQLAQEHSTELAYFQHFCTADPAGLSSKDFAFQLSQIVSKALPNTLLTCNLNTLPNTFNLTLHRFPTTDLIDDPQSPYPKWIYSLDRINSYMALYQNKRDFSLEGEVFQKHAKDFQQKVHDWVCLKLGDPNHLKEGQHYKDKIWGHYKDQLAKVFLSLEQRLAVFETIEQQVCHQMSVFLYSPFAQVSEFAEDTYHIIAKAVMSVVKSENKELVKVLLQDLKSGQDLLHFWQEAEKRKQNFLAFCQSQTQGEPQPSTTALESLSLPPSLKSHEWETRFKSLVWYALKRHHGLQIAPQDRFMVKNEAMERFLWIVQNLS